jgi:ATP-dependent Clp protease ATP-binding subunit ClpC
LLERTRRCLLCAILCAIGGAPLSVTLASVRVNMSEPKQLSKRAQRVLLLANRESKRFNCPHVASEHLLLGALAYRSPAVSGTLRRAGLALHEIRAFVAQVGSAPEEASHGYGPSMRGALRRSCEHCEALKHRRIQPEHLVLGVLDEKDGGAVRVLRHFGIDVRATKRRIVHRLSG